MALERTGGVMVYDVTDPENAEFVNYINSRDFAGIVPGSEEYDEGELDKWVTGGDVAPEGLAFLSATDSPNGKPMLLAACEVSGTVAAYELDGNQSGGNGGGSSSGGSGSSSSNRPDASVSGAGGKVSASSNGTITITPDDGYEISKITVNGEEVAIPADGRLTGLDKNDKVVVTFARITDEQPEEPDGNATPFADVSDSAWYAEAVQYVYESGMMNGTSATLFTPDAATNRAMLVTILYRLEGEPAAQGSGFADVAAGSYYADAVAWAAENGIVNGVSETSFAPDDSITREQLAAILYRYASYKDYDVTASGSLSAYTDAAQVSGYAAAAMQWANGEGLITGVTGTALDPQGSATRAQVATILMRFCEGIAG